MDINQLIGETTDYDKKLALEEKKPKSWWDLQMQKVMRRKLVKQ